MKRALDLLLAVLLLIPLVPVLLFIGLWIRFDSPGPIFYRGVRVGRDGRRFRIFKFRTMVMNADRIGGPSTADDDPRITRVGWMVRKHKLDELPQAINVLRGDMSFVGPRPEVPFYVDMLKPEERAILTVRPGITDWASLRFSDEGEIFAGAADVQKEYMEKVRPEKIRLQLEYVRRHSFAVDFLIMARTATLLFGRLLRRRKRPEVFRK